MKVMVCLKQVPHADARLDIRADGAWIQEENIKFEINSYDTYALEEALRIKDAGEAEVVVVSIGPDRVTQALRTALGMGADRAIHVVPAGLLDPPDDLTGRGRDLVEDLPGGRVAIDAVDELPDLSHGSPARPAVRLSV